MTDAPRSLLAFLIGTRCEGYSRARAARVLGSTATVDRALRVLLKCRAITRQHGGRSTPSKITVLIGLPEFLMRYRNLTRYVPKVDALNAKTDALSGVLNLKVISKERKPPQAELGGRTQTQNRPQRAWEPDPIPDDVIAAFAAEHEARRLRLSA